MSSNDKKFYTDTKLPDDELLTLSQKTLNEDPRTTPRDIKALKDWIKKQPHLDKYVRQGHFYTAP